MSADTKIDADNVVIYANRRCPYCMLARQFFRDRGIVYTEIDVDINPSERINMERLSQRRTVPQIFFGQQHIGGYTDLMAWYANAER